MNGDGDPVVKHAAKDIGTGSLNNNLNTAEEAVQEVQSKNAIWNIVPLIANGANGDPVAKHAVKGIRTGSLNNKLNMAEDIVGEVQSKDAIWNHVHLIAYGVNGEPAAKPVDLDFKEEL